MSAENDENDASKARVVPFPETSRDAPNVAKRAADNDASSETESAEIDAFFARSFSLDAERRENDSVGDAFAGGLRSIFAEEIAASDAENDAAESSDDDAATDEENDVDASDAERFQRDLDAERRESLDGVLRQNDADFLYEAGGKYERPRASDADFDRRPASSERPNDAALAESDSVDAASGRRVAIDPTSILEAMLFVGDRDNKPLSLARAAELMRDVSETEALEALADLNERYFRNGAPYRIVRDGDGYRMALRPEFDEIAAKFGGKTKEFKLSQPAIDALALVAYKQPITLEEILEARNNAAGVLAQLVKRDLVALEKRTVGKKKVAYYQTTPRFLKLFNLESLDDLPIVGDVDYR